MHGRGGFFLNDKGEKSVLIIEKSKGKTDLGGREPSPS